jgi:hypothetical protein
MKVERQVTKSIPNRQSSPFSFFIQQERVSGTWIIDEDAVRWALFSLFVLRLESQRFVWLTSFCRGQQINTGSVFFPSVLGLL